VGTDVIRVGSSPGHDPDPGALLKELPFVSLLTPEATNKYDCACSQVDQSC